MWVLSVACIELSLPFSVRALHDQHNQKRDHDRD